MRRSASSTRYSRPDGHPRREAPSPDSPMTAVRSAGGARRLRAAQDPRVGQRGRGAQRRARRLVERPRALTSSASEERRRRPGASQPACVPTWKWRGPPSSAGFHRVRHKEQVVFRARPRRSMTPGGFARPRWRRQSGLARLSARDFTVGCDLEGRVRRGHRRQRRRSYG